MITEITQITKLKSSQLQSRHTFSVMVHKACNDTFGTKDKLYQPQKFFITRLSSPNTQEPYCCVHTIIPERMASVPIIKQCLPIRTLTSVVIHDSMTLFNR